MAAALALPRRRWRAEGDGDGAAAAACSVAAAAACCDGCDGCDGFSLFASVSASLFASALVDGRGYSGCDSDCGSEVELPGRGRECVAHPPAALSLPFMAAGER